MGVKDGRLITVKTSDVTYINRFLGLFNIGALAGTDVTITRIATHLSQYDFTGLEEGQELTTLRKIAYRSFEDPINPGVCHPTARLLNKVAKLTITDWGPLYLSPTTTAKDILRQVYVYSSQSKLHKTNERNEILDLRPIELITTHEAVHSLCPKRHSLLYVPS